jgi:hypothetical protein
MKTKNKKVIKKFNTRNFNFKKLFLNHFKKFNTRKLENIHNHIPKKYLPNKIVSVKNDQNPKIYKYLYKIDKGYDLNKMNKPSSFLKLYEKFVKYIAQNIFKEFLIYQSRPTLRIMFPNNKAVGDYHRDRDYNHPIEEINVWVPITSSINSNTIWIESKFNKNDYRPANLNYGQFLIFDSALKHGNNINLENKTRISFDFRVIPYLKWNKIQKRNQIKSSFNQKLKFKIGDYYKLMKYNKK